MQAQANTIDLNTNLARLVIEDATARAVASGYITKAKRDFWNFKFEASRDESRAFYAILQRQFKLQMDQVGIARNDIQKATYKFDLWLDGEMILRDAFILGMEWQDLDVSDSELTSTTINFCGTEI